MRTYQIDTLLRLHGAAFLLGFLLDLMIGDPYCLPHPIRLIGTVIGTLEKRWNTKDEEKARRRGRLLVLVMVSGTVLATAAILFIGYQLHPYVGVLAEAVLTYYILALKCLRVESMKVCKALKAGDVEGARYAVSMIVGRDTKVLDDIGIAKAAIETVAENASDGVIAPMLYTALGGPVLGLAYKAINTMDSMVGYKNERYLHFGRAAALLDDVVNYIPSRVSAYLMIVACAFLGKDFSVRGAAQIHRRDCRNHASPNSAQTESTCAGALGIRLAGDAWYFGELHRKPFIGDALRPVEYADIERANRLLYAASFLCLLACALVWLLICFVI